MAWIKRNLLFVIGTVVSLALLVFAGYYNYTGWQHKIEEAKALDEQYAQRRRLNTQEPHPGSDTVNNIELAREQVKKIRGVLAAAGKYFQAPLAIPNTTNLSSSQFTAALRDTVSELSRSAAAASVQLPPDFKFSFSQQLRLLNFTGSLEPLAQQLGEVKALSDVLIKAKVNSIDGIQRERVSPDDAAGPQADYYTDTPSETNDLAILTPYQITFRSFSRELAEVLATLASSPHGFIVQRIRVEPAPATTLEGAAPPVAQTRFYQTPTVSRAAREADEAARDAASLRPDLFKYNGPSAYPRPTPAPAYPTTSPAYGAPTPYYPATSSTRAGSQMVLNERQLRITLLIQVVKLLPKN